MFSNSPLSSAERKHFAALFNSSGKSSVSLLNSDIQNKRQSEESFHVVSQLRDSDEVKLF